MKKLCIGFLALFITLLSAVFSLSKDANAVQITSLGAVQFGFKTSPNSSYTIITNNNVTLPYKFIDTPSSYIASNYLNFSATTGQSLQGNYFSGTATFTLTTGQDTPIEGFDYSGGYDCSRLILGRIRPEQGTVQSENYNIKSCRVVSNPSGGNNMYITLTTSGRLISNTTVTSYFVSLRANDATPFLEFQGAAPATNNHLWAYIVRDMNVEFTVTQDSTTQGLGNVEQAINETNNILEENQQQDQQDRDNVQSASDSGEDNAEASQQQNEQATSSLLSVIGSFIQALGAPASNCRVRTDLGNLDLGTLDFCSGKPAQLTPVINTVCAMVMCIPIYLIARDLFKRFVYITTFAQGGEYK